MVCMFVIKAEPAPENRYHGRIAQGRFHIWVISGSSELALDRAKAYIKKQLWTPGEVEYAFEILPEQLPSLHEDEVALYQKALVYGIAADIIASPIEEGSSDDPMMVLPPN